MNDRVSRRSLARAGIAGIVGLLDLAACKTESAPFTCTDTRALSSEEMHVRSALAYLDRSPDPKKTCALCHQYVAGASGSCGACNLFKGPIHPQGSCKAFAPQG